MNLSKIKALYADTAVYGVGSLATRTVGFFLIPLYTAYLTPEDYGALALVNMAASFIAAVLHLGQPNALARFYVKHAENAAAQREVLATFLGTALLMGLPFLGVVAAAKPFSYLFFQDASLSVFLILAVCAVYLDHFQKPPLFVLRAARRAGRYVLYTLIRSLGSILMIVIFVVLLRRGAMGVLIGQLLSAVLFTAGLHALVLRGVRPGLNPKVAMDMLKFGAPLVVGDLLAFVFRYSNRYFLNAFFGEAEVGLFALGSRFGEIVGLFNAAVWTAWPIFLYESERDRDAPRLYARAMTYYLLAAGWVGTGIVVFTPEVYRFMVVNPRFHPSAAVVPFAVVTNILMGVHLFSNIGMNLKERTVFYSAATLGAAAASVLLNMLLVPRLGIHGAALATLLAYAVQAGLTLWLSHRLYPVPYEVRRIGTLVVVFGACAVVGSSLPEWSLAARVALKLAILIGGAPCCLAVLGFFAREERQRGRALLGRVLLR